jgi:transposase-like protein
VPNNEAGRSHRRHRSRAEADQVVADYEASGLSREAFCVQYDVTLKSLDRYVTRYRKQKQKQKGEESQRFVAVEVTRPTGTGGELAVLLATGRRIEVKRGFDPGTLRQLVAVLEHA